MSKQQADYYAVLGVLRDASAEEIRRAYLQAAQRLHPDKNTTPGETELFLEIQQAYEVLSNDRRRAQYDATLPKEEEAGPPAVVRHEILVSRPSLVRLKEPQVVYVHLELSPLEQAEKIAAPPLNICLVLDRSTSMQGPKMDMVKNSAIQILRGLRPQDLLSVVSFSDRAEIIISSSLNLERSKLEARIQMMQTSGGTEIYYGLEAGLNEIQKNVGPSRVNHLILLTDGHTYGDEQACLELAENANQQNIGISAFGIGGDWNDVFLDAIASRTGGNSAYVAKPEDIQRLLLDKFKSLGSMFAEDVLMEHKSSAGVSINYAFRLTPDGGPIAIEQSRIHLGPILQDTPLTVLFELMVEPSAVQNETVTLLDGSLKPSIAARPTPAPPIRLRLTRNVEPVPASEAPPAKILNALSRLTLHRLQERARLEAEQGQYDSAADHFQKLAAHLLSQGQTQLAKTILFEMEQIRKTHTLSNEIEKQIKYGTRALLTKDSREETQ